MYNLKNMKNHRGGVLPLTRSSTLTWVPFTFFNCTNVAKSRKTSQIAFARKKTTVFQSLPVIKSLKKGDVRFETSVSLKYCSFPEKHFSLKTVKKGGDGLVWVLMY